MTSAHSLHICFLLLFASFFAGEGWGQDRQFRTTDLEGFPRGNVQDVLQDQYGFLWIATSDGLGKYDGHQLIEYRYSPHDSNSLSSNYITNLSLDRSGNVLIGTHNGISVYLQQEDRFLRLPGNGELLPPGTSDIVHHIIQDHRGWYWHGTYQGLFRRKSLQEPAERILPNEALADSIPYTNVWKIHEDQEGRLWMGSGSGLIVADTSATIFTVFTKDRADEHGLRVLQTWDFEELADGTIYIGSESGLFQALPQADGWTFKRVLAEQLSEAFVNCMFNEGDTTLWIGTYRGGLNEIDLRKRIVQVHRHDENRISSIGLDQIQTIYRDRTNLLWVGAGGMLQFTAPQLDNFRSIQVEPNAPASLSNDIVKSVLLDQHKNLWIGTYSGLNLLPAEKWTAKDFTFEKYFAEEPIPNQISHNNIFGLHEDSQGYLWVCTFKGLNYLNLNAPLEAQQFETIELADGLPHDFIHEIKEIQPGQYWLATYGKLARMYFNPELPGETSFDWFNHGTPGEGNLVNATVYTMAQDRFGRWWFGTYDGLSQHRLLDGRDFFDNYQHLPNDSTSLSNNSIRCFYLDSQGRFWIGTRTGLNLVLQDRPTDRARFQRFGMREGFPNDVIHFIEEDEEGQLWIGTNAGLAVFQPELAIAGKPAIKKVYTEADGLTASSFVFRSSFKDAEGQFFLGTANGLNYFHPEQVVTNQRPPQATFTQLRVQGQIIRPQVGKHSVLPKPIQQAQSLSLAHHQNQIELYFSAMDFHAPAENQYAYRLLGLHDNWLGGKGSYRAMYTRLPPGEYTFQVKAANSDGVWSEEIRELQLNVSPPWWRSPLAYVAYVLTLGSLIWWWIQQRIQTRTQALAQQYAIQNARLEERTRLRQKNAADFHDELGHRLTKISLFLELAKRHIRQPQELFTHFQKIKTHVDGLSSGMRDLIWALDPEKDNLLQTMMRLRDFGEQLFEDTNTQFRFSGFQGELEDILLQPDTRQQLLLLFKEAMHNCLKYAQASEASLRVDLDGENLRIIFQDNGQGFVLEDHRGKGYGLKNMQQRAEKMGAQLHIQTIPGQGTSLTLGEIPQMG